MACPECGAAVSARSNDAPRCNECGWSGWHHPAGRGARWHGCEALSPLVDGVENGVDCELMAGHEGSHLANADPGDDTQWLLYWFGSDDAARPRD